MVRRGAVTLAESGNLLMLRGRARDQGDWMKDAKLLVDVGNAAYKAAQAKDAAALAALAGALDASCTTCHKQYRPERISEGRRVEMSYSRRNFLKAAGSGVVLTAVGWRNTDRGARASSMRWRRRSRAKRLRSSSMARPTPPNTKRAPRCGK